MTQAANFKNGIKTPRPKPLRRPTDPAPVAVDGSEAMARYHALLAEIESDTGAPKGIAPAQPEMETATPHGR